MYDLLARTLLSASAVYPKSLVPPTKMDQNTLEGLPCEIIALILCSFSSFRDLFTLIKASVVCYRNFVVLPEKILECVARNILGPAWEDATILLVHQRSGFLPGLVPDYAGVKEGLAKKFLLERRDVPNILANQRFFDNCNIIYSALNGSDMIPSAATPQGALSTESFYRVWLLALRFGYEDIETFSRRPALSLQELVDIRLLTCFIIHTSHFKHRFCPPRWSVYVNPWFLGNMFWQLTNRDTVTVFKMIATAKHNILLQLKMVSHMITAVRIGYPTNPPGLRGRIPGLRIDYSDPNMTVKDIVDKYGLSCGWE